MLTLQGVCEVEVAEFESYLEADRLTKVDKTSIHWTLGHSWDKHNFADI